MRITEIFHSVQGEGRYMGWPTVFVRTTGCHLRCVWCDTAYSFHGGEPRTLDEIFGQIRAYGSRMICFTGGEPLLQRDAVEFVGRALGEGYQVVVETSGSLPLDDYVALGPRENLCLSVDVKCPGSRMHEHNRFDELPKLSENDQVKMVIADAADYEYAVKALGHVPAHVPVFFQPVWGGEARWLADRILEDRVPVKLSLQLHKYVWGDVPGH